MSWTSRLISEMKHTNHQKHVHILNFQVATTDEARQSSVAVETYVTNLERKKEDRDKVEERAKLMEQVATLSAINQSDTMTVTPLLVRSMLEEAAKLRGELQDIVSMIM